MIVRFTLIILSTIFFLSKSDAQKTIPDRPFEKIEYIDLAPIWQEVCFDENFLDISDGYNRNSGIIDKVMKISDDYLYNAYLQHGLSGIYGGKLECRDITSGQILWDYGFGMKNNENVEIPKIIEIQGDQLILWTNIRRGSGTSSFGFYDMVLGKRVFDKHTGSLLSFSHPDISDNNLINMSFDIGLFHSSVIFREKENFRYLDLTSTQNLCKPILNSYLVNEKGTIISKDTALTRFLCIINVVQIHPDTLLSLEFSPNALSLKFMSPQLKVYKVEKVKYEFDLLNPNILISDISLDKRKMFISNKRNESYPDNYYEYYVIDFDGNMLSYHAFEGEYSEDNFPIDWTDGVVKFLGYNLDINGLESTSTLRLFTKEGKNPKQIIKEFRATDGWRFILPVGIEKVTDDYLVTFGQYSLMEDTFRIEKLTLDWGATAYGHMLLDGNKLGLSSSTEENQKMVFTLSPNPTSDFVTLTYDGLALQNMFISDLSGNKVLNWTFDKNSGTTIDVSHIPSGLYFVTVTDISGRKQTEKLVVHH